MGWQTLDDLELTGKRVLTRVDINVPMEDGRVTDATRIERIVPTVRDILAAGGQPILLAHFGRPKGKPVAEMSLSAVVPALATAFGQPVAFSPATTGPEAAAVIAKGGIVLLENTRFHPGEEKNDPAFATDLAALGDLYVNDAFSAAHRAHASTEALARLLPSAAGRLMGEELSALDAALGNPQRPVVAVVGGAKVSTKLDLIGNLLDKVDAIVIGGGMANTFLAAQGRSVGTSLCEHELAGTAQEIMAAAKTKGCALILPVDAAISAEFKADACAGIVAVDAVPDDMMILDAGPASVEAIAAAFDEAKTIIWNGPLGAFEMTPYDAATNAAALHAARLTKAGKITSVAGGGDTVAALNAAGAGADFTYVSTAGGAFLEWMEGKTLPGVAALST